MAVDNSSIEIHSVRYFSLRIFFVVGGLSLQDGSPCTYTVTVCSVEKGICFSIHSLLKNRCPRVTSCLFTSCGPHEIRMSNQERVLY